jgi:predicted nucleic-acid-binding protein
MTRTLAMTTVSTKGQAIAQSVARSKTVGHRDAVDVNIIVRFLTGDDPLQAARARSLISGHLVFVSTPVLPETEWVLRSAYGFAPLEVVTGLRVFAGLLRVTLEDAALAAQALVWISAGMDFADALHVSRASTCDAFVTFDVACLKKARAHGQLKIRKP